MSKKGKSDKPEEGIVFPRDDKDERTSTPAGKNAFAAAAKAGGDDALAQRILSERNWRYGYTRHVLDEVRLAAKSADIAFKMAEAGLDYLHNNFEFIRNGKTMTVAEAMKNPEKNTLFTTTIQGTGSRTNRDLEVPYKGRTLRGQELLNQIDRWVKYGTIEPGCGDAMRKVAQNPETLNLSNDYFVLLGAGSAMGPFSLLLEMGANVIAIDLDLPRIWSRLISVAKSSSGTLTFATKIDGAGLNDQQLADVAGCNMTTRTPEILDWLKTIYPDKPLIIGNYAYLDGELHVRVSLAADSIMKGLCEARPNTTIAFLNTPTHAYLISEDAWKAAKANYSAKTPVNLFLTVPRLLAGKKYLAKNALPEIQGENGKKMYICDGLVVAQGPNYALAKCMQHWRAVLAQKYNIRVSSNIAPSTATASVVHNRQFAWAYGGFHNFKPMEIFQQETSNAVMAALLVHDVKYTTASEKLENPWLIFSRSAFHGGVWRAGYKMSSVGEVSALFYFMNKLKFFILLLFVLLLGFFLFR